jgi:hypothetical protein
LAEVFPRLYNLSFNHNGTVDKVVTSFRSCLIFRRRLWGNLGGEWCRILDIVHCVNLVPGDDKVIWNLGQKGFIVKSVYNALQTRVPIRVFKITWMLSNTSKSKGFLVVSSDVG